MLMFHYKYLLFHHYFYPHIPRYLLKHIYLGIHVRRYFRLDTICRPIPKFHNSEQKDVLLILLYLAVLILADKALIDFHQDIHNIKAEKNNHLFYYPKDMAHNQDQAGLESQKGNNHHYNYNVLNPLKG